MKTEKRRDIDAFRLSSIPLNQQGFSRQQIKLCAEIEAISLARSMDIHRQRYSQLNSRFRQQHQQRSAVSSFQPAQSSTAYPVVLPTASRPQHRQQARTKPIQPPMTSHGKQQQQHHQASPSAPDQKYITLANLTKILQVLQTQVKITDNDTSTVMSSSTSNSAKQRVQQHLQETAMRWWKPTRTSEYLPAPSSIARHSNPHVSTKVSPSIAARVEQNTDNLPVLVGSTIFRSAWRSLNSLPRRSSRTPLDTWIQRLRMTRTARSMREQIRRWFDLRKSLMSNICDKNPSLWPHRDDVCTPMITINIPIMWVSLNHVWFVKRDRLAVLFSSHNQPPWTLTSFFDRKHFAVIVFLFVLSFIFSLSEQTIDLWLNTWRFKNKTSSRTPSVHLLKSCQRCVFLSCKRQKELSTGHEWCVNSKVVMHHRWDSSLVRQEIEQAMRMRRSIAVFNDNIFNVKWKGTSREHSFESWPTDRLPSSTISHNEYSVGRCHLLQPLSIGGEQLLPSFAWFQSWWSNSAKRSLRSSWIADETFCKISPARRQNSARAFSIDVATFHKRTTDNPQMIDFVSIFVNRVFQREFFGEKICFHSTTRFDM